MNYMDTGLPARFWDKCIPEPNSGCWLWTAKSLKGYGQFHQSRPRRTSFSHRVSYEAAKGPIPVGYQIDHLCRTPLCCNPAHLEAVPPAVNHARAYARLVRCPAGHEYGPSNPRGRCNTCRNAMYRRIYREALGLARDVFNGIRHAVRSGESMESVAERYGLRRTHVRKVATEEGSQMTITARIEIAAASIAIGIASIMAAAFLGYATARGQPVVSAPPAVMDATPHPIAIHDPVADPLAVVDDFEAMKRHGWPAVILAGGIALALAARTLGKRLPDVAWLAWLNTGKRAFWLAGGVAVASAVLDVLLANGTPYAAGWAGMLALLALLNAKGPD